MESILQAVLALLTAAGLLALAWLCFGALLMPSCAGPVYAVLPVRGSGETLEHDLKSIHYLRSWTGRQTRVVLADAGLNSAGYAAVRALMARESGLSLCPIGELGPYLEGHIT